MNNFSFIKEAPEVTDVDPLAPYLKLTNTVRHDYGGLTTQVLALKKLKNNALDLSFTPNNGQSLKVAISYDLDGMKAWISSHGSTTTDVSVFDVTSSGRTISTPSETEDKYVWVGIALTGYIGYPANGYLSNPEHTYSYVINGAATAPEALLMFKSESATAPSGTFDNPVIIQPNSAGVYDSRYGSCTAGAYYFSLSATVNISRYLTITPSTSRSIGVVVSTNKNDIKNWILNGGTGTLTNGSSHVNSGGGALNVTIDAPSSATYYAAVYDPSAIGTDSCISGNTFTVDSVQENQTGSSSGTYANPYVISSNLTEALAAAHSLGDGECQKGAVYYMFEKCSTATVPLHIELHASSPSQNIGVAFSNDKTELGTFIRTGVYGSIPHVNSDGISLTLSLDHSDGSQYAFLVVYDPTSIGTFSCTSTDTFKISTSQTNCAGGGTGRDGRYNNPFNQNSNWQNVMQADGDCDIDGTIWFNLEANAYCDGTTHLYIYPHNGQNVRLAYGPNQADIKAYIEGGGGGSGSNCGAFYNPGNIYYSNYVDGSGNNYYNTGYNQWTADIGGQVYYSQYDLPDYCGESCGMFDNPGNKYYSAYNDNLNGNYYNNDGYDTWYTTVQVYQYYYSEQDLPGFCQTTCGRFENPGDPHNSNYFAYDSNTQTQSNFYIQTTDEWSDGNVTITDITQLPGYCDPSTCGAFEDPSSYQNSNWIGTDGATYHNVGSSVWQAPNPSWQDNYIYSITNLPNYCDGSGGGGSGGTSVQSIGPYESAYIHINNQTYYAAAYLPDQPGATQCDNFDKFDVSYYVNCYYGSAGGSNSGSAAQDSDPLPIGNNGSFYGNFNSSNQCSVGNFYMRGYFCSQPFDMSVYSGVGIAGVAWSDNLSELNSWANNGRVGVPNGTIHGVSNSGTFTASNSSFTGNIFFVAYTTSSGCFGDTGISINVTQNNCDGSNIGTEESPIAIGNSETLEVPANAGNCFNGKTFMSVTLCGDKDATITVTPPSNAAPQAIIMNDAVDKVKFEVEQNYVRSGIVGSYSNTVLADSASTTSSPLVLNIPSTLSQRTLYFALCDRFQTGNAGAPRCDRTGNTTVTVAQNCPIINIGGVADVSGASRYDYDPFDTQSTNKRGIALAGGDPAAIVTKNLIYIPTLVIDDAASYGVAISATSITSELYTNSNVGVTTLASVKSTTKTEAIVKDNKVYVKPLGTYEFQFDNASFYTALLVNTFVTNVGTFVRNQVVNAGDSFTGGRSQFSYVTNISGSDISVIVPVTQEFVHTVTHDETVTDSQVGHGNTVRMTTNAPQSTGTIVDTTSTGDEDGQYHIRVRI